MSVRKDLLAEIEAKAKRIKQLKEKAKTKGDVESFVFDFFREVDDFNKFAKEADEETKTRQQGVVGSVLTAAAIQQLEKNIQVKFDHGCRVEASLREDGQVQGVLIHWSKSYQVANKAPETFYIGVEQMLFN